MSSRTQELRINNNVCTLRGFSEKQVNVKVDVNMSDKHSRGASAPASNQSRRVTPSSNHDKRVTPTSRDQKRITFGPTHTSDPRTQKAITAESARRRSAPAAPHKHHTGPRKHDERHKEEEFKRHMRKVFEEQKKASERQQRKAQEERDMKRRDEKHLALQQNFQQPAGFVWGPFGWIPVDAAGRLMRG